MSTVPVSTHTLYLAAPRGFCAGVDRAIDIVEMALQVFGAPVYVRHEIVHNRHVVDRLRGMGAVFVDDIAEIPEGSVERLEGACTNPEWGPGDVALADIGFVNQTAYEPGVRVADGGLVMLHGRFSGFGGPTNWIVVDILRIEDGVLVEHWDVIQDEATREQSKSGMPMFGTSFPKA